MSRAFLASLLAGILGFALISVVFALFPPREQIGSAPDGTWLAGRLINQAGCPALDQTVPTRDEPERLLPPIPLVAATATQNAAQQLDNAAYVVVYGRFSPRSLPDVLSVVCLAQWQRGSPLPTQVYLADRLEANPVAPWVWRGLVPLLFAAVAYVLVVFAPHALTPRT